MKNISAALVKAQSLFKPVNKDSENPFFKSSYADLSTILQSVTPVLSECGLAVIQPMRVDNGVTILITKLIHSSGESLDSEMILPPHSDPQKYGSLITYYKRYQLQAMLGISTEEDDDGNSVSMPKTTQQVSNQVNNILASDAQIGAMKKLGIKFSDNVSKSEASKLLAEFNKGR